MSIASRQDFLYIVKYIPLQGFQEPFFVYRQYGILRAPEQLSFLIRRKIAREGTKGTHDLRDTENAVLPIYEERLLEALQRDVLDYIEKVLP